MIPWQLQIRQVLSKLKKMVPFSQRKGDPGGQISALSPVPAGANWFLHSAVLGLIPWWPPAAQASVSPSGCTHILPDRSCQLDCFSPGLGSGTFPWGDLCWSPYLTPEPSLIHQPHGISGDRECFSLKTGGQPLHLELREPATNGVCFLFVSVTGVLANWGHFYCCGAQLPSRGKCCSRRHQLGAY